MIRATVVLFVVGSAALPPPEPASP